MPAATRDCHTLRNFFYRLVEATSYECERQPYTGARIDVQELKIACLYMLKSTTKVHPFLMLPRPMSLTWLSPSYNRTLVDAPARTHTTSFFHSCTGKVVD